MHPRPYLPIATILLVAMLTSCNVEHSQDNASTPAPSAQPVASATPHAMPGGTPSISGAPRIAPGRGQLLVHYHRRDGDYSTAGLWTWDARQKHTPEQNEMLPSAQDDFGSIFVVEPARYGSADKIGLLPRMSRDWSRKDGPDRIWTPGLGNEVWIVSGKPALFARRPDLAPHIEGAFADKVNLVTLSLSQPLPAASLTPARVHLRDEQGRDALINSADPTREDGSPAPSGAPASGLAVRSSMALDFAAHHYTVSVDGLGTQPVTPRGLLDDARLYFTPDAILGATWSPPATTFRVFAPTAERVSVILYDAAAGDQGRLAVAMHATGRGIWQATVQGDLAGKFYMLLPEGGRLPGRETLDPCATNAVSSSSRARITPPTPPPPALAHGSMAAEDMIIYEMHVRDFTAAANSGVSARGLYSGWTEGGASLDTDRTIKTGVDHLAELGVTHVQIMPVLDFANDEAARAYNWGYTTTAFFSPEGMFASNPDDDSRVRELKGLIAALHQRGIGVILDVVFNHTSESAPFPDIVPDYYYRRLPDGSPANGSGCGNEFRTEAPMARKYIVDSLAYWMREYGVDGFRFDLMALVDRETMRAAASELRAINPAVAIYGEPWTGGDSPLGSRTDKAALHEVPVGAFNDDFRNALKGSPDGPSSGFIQDGSNADALKKAMLVSDWFSDPGQSINYMTCHDNLVLWDKLKLSMPDADDDLIKRTAKLGYLVLLTSQGVPFMQGGEEFGRSKGGNNNSFDSPDSVNEVDWSLKAKNLDLFHYVRDLIKLRKEHPLFRLRSRAEVRQRVHFVETASGLACRIDGHGLPGETWGEAMVAVNPDSRDPLVVPLPGGDWEIAIDEHGSARSTPAALRLSVPPKSGLVLYRQ